MSGKSTGGARRAVAVAACLLSLAPLSWPAATARGGAPPPDILLITVDTLRADHLSSYGHPKPLTPHLDRLLSGGARFTQARTVETLTHPSMTSMLTSMHPHQHGGTRNGLRMRPGLGSLPKMLSKRGYRTAAFIGNWTLKPKVSGLDEHFQVYRPVLSRKRWFGLVRSEASALDLTEAALEWLDEQAGEGTWRPVLLWAHYADPHGPYRFHEEEGRKLGLDKSSKSQRYATEVAFTDRSIGELLAGFRERRGPRKPLIVFASDHGESLGEHGYWGHGRHLYETELHIPMGITWEGSIGPMEVTARASILDLAPTVLGLLERPIPETFAGYDWSGVLNGGEPPEGRVTRHQSHRGAVMVKHKSKKARKKGLLAVALVGDGGKEVMRTESGQILLFDVGTRPSASLLRDGNRNAPSPDLSSWLLEVLDGLRSLSPTEPTLDEESLERLRSLGYVD